MGEGRAPDLPAAHRFSWRSLPRDIKLLAVGLVLVLVLGIAYLIAVPFRPKPIVPLLGWSEPTSPRKPAPAPTRRPAPPAQKDVRP